jgi:hypothetical protein
MSERDGYVSGVPVPEARAQTRERLPCWVSVAPLDPGGAAFTVSRLVIGSEGA